MKTNRPTEEIIATTVENCLREIGVESFARDSNLRDDCGLDSLDILDLSSKICYELHKRYPDYVDANDIEFTDYPVLSVEGAINCVVREVLHD